MLDSVILGWFAAVVLVEVFGRLLGGDPLGRESASSQLVGLSSGRTLVGLLLVIVAYEIVPVVWRGATLGKAMLGLRVVSLDSWTHPGVLSAVLRAGVLYAPLAIPTVGLVVVVVVILPALIWPTRRGIHDMVAGTAVVSAPRPTRPEEDEPGPVA